jgi:hypothetical protein
MFILLLSTKNKQLLGLQEAGGWAIGGSLWNVVGGGDLGRESEFFALQAVVRRIC